MEAFQDRYALGFTDSSVAMNHAILRMTFDKLLCNCD